MLEAVFISDLHLHPEMDEITTRFIKFLEKYRHKTKNIYILGDFFHVWAGDDTDDAWSRKIAALLKDISSQNVAIYFMYGNRDFLLGNTFATRAGFKILQDPTIIELGKHKVLLTHGDAFCTKDRTHQLFRVITRNNFFRKFFLLLPRFMRLKFVGVARKYSKGNKLRVDGKYDVVKNTMNKAVYKHHVDVVIHGHTHKLTEEEIKLANLSYKHYILSDWDDHPRILCYDKSRRFYFELAEG